MFDALTLAAIVDEIGPALRHGRVQRVLLLDDLSLGLEVYAGHRRHQLLISAHPQEARLHLVSERLTADRERITPFLLLLRKYVRGGQVLDLAQPPLERTVSLSIAKFLPLDKPADAGAGAARPVEARPGTDDQATDDDEQPGYEVVVRLIVEIMGRHSNIVLVDSGGAIIDSIKRVPASVNRYRTVLPRRRYVPPPDQPKADPRAVDAGWWRALRARVAPADPLAPLLVRELRGISPQVARELAYRVAGAIDAPVAAVPDDAALPAALQGLLAHLDRHDWSPRLYRRDGRPAAFSPFPLLSLTALTEEPVASISVAVEAFFTSTRAVTGHGQSKARLIERLTAERERVAARRRALDEQVQAAAAAEALRRSGELIYAFLHTLRPGQTRLEADGLSIALDPARSPVENAQAYFERYRRARAAAASLPELVQAADLELAYLDQLLAFASLAEGLDELQALEAEWQERAAGAATPRRRPAARAPRRLRTPRGDVILIGRNGQQNDQVTFDLAGPDDLWLHARGLPGAHVILQPRPGAREPDRGAIETAAQLAAYYSPARGATAVEVDVTPRRWVRKVKGGPPGLVTYRNEYTVRVVPQSAETLRERGRLAPA